MVAVGIVGVLAMLALPRYQQFMVTARRGEAKSNLSHISSLQSLYWTEHYTYYSGAPMTAPKGIGYKNGADIVGEHACGAGDEDQGLCNALGFHPKSVGELRYLYQLRDNGKTAVASAASDEGKYIFPDCRGYGAAECGFPSGDALRARVDGKPTVCRNITNYCPLDGDAPLVCTGVCSPAETPAPYPVCCKPEPPCPCTISSTTPISLSPLANNKYTCESFMQTRTLKDSWTDCDGNSCKADSTRTEPLAATGTKPLDCTTAGLAACPCTTGDARTTSCCGTTTCICDPTGTSQTACVLDDTAIRLDDIWQCRQTTCTKDVTINYAPSAGCPPSPPDPCPAVATTQTATVYGTLQPTCTNTCSHWSPPVEWSNCQLAPDDGNVCTQDGYKTRQCDNPCPGLELTCALSEYAKQNCTCPVPMCGAGSDTLYRGWMLNSARVHCVETDQNDPNNTYDFSSPKQSDGTYNCKCLVIQPTCDEDDRNTCQDSIEQQHDHEWRGWPDCRCQCATELAGIARTCSGRAGSWVWLQFPQCKCACSIMAADDCNDDNKIWHAQSCKCTEPPPATRYSVTFKPSCVVSSMGVTSVEQVATGAGLTNTNLLGHGNIGDGALNGAKDKWEELVKAAMCTDLDLASPNTIKFTQMISNSADENHCQGADPSGTTPSMTVSYECPSG